MTYICRVEEDWSLSNAWGLRTSQVMLAHNTLLFTVNLSFSVFNNMKPKSVHFNRSGNSVWFMYSTRGAMRYSAENPGMVTLKAFQWTLSSQQHRITVSVSPCHIDAKVIVFANLLSRWKTQSSQPPVSPLSPSVIQSHLSSFQVCSSVILLYSLSLFSLDHGALGSLMGDVQFGCPRSIHPFWWNRIHWSPLCPVVSISQLLSGECQQSGICECQKSKLTRTRAKNWSPSQTDRQTLITIILLTNCDIIPE